MDLFGCVFVECCLSAKIDGVHWLRGEAVLSWGMTIHEYILIWRFEYFAHRFFANAKFTFQKGQLTRRQIQLTAM